jgi:hypothetical protein
VFRGERTADIGFEMDGPSYSHGLHGSVRLVFVYICS